VPRGLILAMLLVAGTSAAAANPSQDVDRARGLYSRGQYQQTVDTLRPLLYPRAQFDDEKELIEAHYLLGVSYYYLGQREEARKEFAGILFINPDYKLDPVVEDVEVYSLFQEVKKQLRRDLDEIRKKREEEERRKRQPTFQTEITIHERNPAFNWFPLGAPQFQAGRSGWGTFFLVSQGAFGGTSIALFTYQALKYGLFDTTYPPEDFSSIKTLQTVQIGTGVVFFLLYGWGVLDAYASPVTTRTVRQVPIAPNVTFVPWLSPEASGLGMRWEF
jgi:tetratricopeptide (TPR) repeat protein